MGLSKTRSISFGTGTTVFGAGSEFAGDRIKIPKYKDDLLELDGEQICYGLWEDNVLDRLMNMNNIDREYMMEEYIDYLTSIFKELPGVHKPPSRPPRLRLPAFEDEYETHKYASSYPSLTDGSTISGASSLVICQRNPSRYSPAWREPLLPIKSAQSKDLREIPSKPSHADAIYSSYWKPTLEGWPNSSNDPRSVAVKMLVPPQIRAGIGAQFDVMSDSDSLDSETSTDISSDDDEYDPFENLNNAIRQVFSSNKQLADRVINYLVQLPPDRRAQVYGYGPILSHGADNFQESSIIVSCGSNSRPTKRKRIDEAPPSNLNQDQALGSDDHDDRVLVDCHPPESSSPHRRFACGYNIFDRVTYSPRNTRGRTATRYKSCAGPGFTSINHYKRHLERVHTLHQCPRCGNIFDKPGELQNHLAQDPRCDRLTFEQERGMSQAMWDRVKDIFKRRRKSQGEPSDEERWFLAWDALFPEVERPPTAYYEEPHTHNAYQSRVLEVFDFLLADRPQLAPARNHRDDLMEALRHALNVAGQGSRSDQGANGPIVASPLVQEPLPNTSAQDRMPNINQTDISEPRRLDTANTYIDVPSRFEGPRNQDSEPIDNLDLFGVSGSSYPEMVVTGDGYVEGLYSDFSEYGNW
ncbi:hypothetical protein F5Y00DRAFT_269715 [Daldinia vernicosa]|uniref:uncharacterized protein n=1 Tax=Daldinia vernicosa TaxID=114800 RepID=UPI002007523A|nr:uncharacterized protein F5Y00DRAFT_269715 [Daldinia vernicosa]KAI0849083.1 hypothetical protein F5Y00DRAFT_269715 [Daldinia vernicosa]